MRALVVRALVLGGVAVAALVAAPGAAEADCRSASVCFYQYGRQVCRYETQCTAPRAPICTFVDRCAPMRSCTSYYGQTTCVYRDVCRRERICS